MFKECSITFFLIVSLTCVGTEKAKESKETTPVVTAAAQMTVIKEWDQISPFADQIVLYEATNPVVTGGNAGYPFPQNQSTKTRIGYISSLACPIYIYGSRERAHAYLLNPKRIDRAYLLNLLLNKKHAAFDTVYLTTSCIKDNENQSILMRSTTPQERIDILQAIKNNNAEFEDMWSPLGEPIMTALKR